MLPVRIRRATRSPRAGSPVHTPPARPYGESLAMRTASSSSSYGMRLRFCEHPEIPALLRAQPELIPKAVEKLLRLHGSFVCIGRTARADAQIDGHQIGKGERVILYWASANHDEAEFTAPDAFDLDRPTNRHIAFGAGPHRCVGSNLARMNLRIAPEEIVRRLGDLKLQPGAGIEFHSTFNRAPLSVPITFTAS
jgi:cytochrome P450